MRQPQAIPFKFNIMKNSIVYLLAVGILLGKATTYAQETHTLKSKNKTEAQPSSQRVDQKHQDNIITPMLPDTSLPKKAKRVRLSKEAGQQSMRDIKDPRLHQTEIQNQNAERRPLPEKPSSGVEAKPSAPQQEKPADIKVKNPQNEPTNSKTGPKPKEKAAPKPKDAKAQ